MTKYAVWKTKRYLTNWGKMLVTYHKVRMSLLFLKAFKIRRENNQWQDRGKWGQKRNRSQKNKCKWSSNRKRCSLRREMQVKMIPRHNFLPIQLAKTPQASNRLYWGCRRQDRCPQKPQVVLGGGDGGGAGLSPEVHVNQPTGSLLKFVANVKKEADVLCL